MKAVVHKCPNCKANLEIKENETNGVCEFCRAPYSIDDGVIRVEHTVEFKNDNPLKIANTTLYKFKEYEESEILFRQLLFKLGHKPEVYIGLILSITHEFTKDLTTISAMNEINELWERYTAIGRPKEIDKYRDTYTEMNKKFWLNQLNNFTDHLKDYKCSSNIMLLDSIYTNYVSYCGSEEKSKMDTKYTKFKNQKLAYETRKKKTIRISLISIISLIIILFLISYIVLINEKPVVKSDIVKVSDLHHECDLEGICTSYEFIFNNFEDTNSKFSVTNVSIDKELLKLYFDVKLSNIYKTETYEYEFKIVDDHGPIISDNHCEITDSSEVDLSNCFSIYDYSDGIISNDKATLYLEAIDFKIVGEKLVTMEVNDNNGNKTTGSIIVNVTNSNIQLDIKLEKDYIELNKTDTLSYTITPDVPNKNVIYNYDKNYITFDETSRKITAVKVGESELCATAEYDTSKKACVKIRVIPICKSSYTFNFDGSKETKIISGTDFCPGKYKLYATVLNKTDVYTLTKRSSGFGDIEFIKIWKDTPAFNDEGKKYVFALDSQLEVPSGVTKVKLVKQ